MGVTIETLKNNPTKTSMTKVIMDNSDRVLNIKHPNCSKHIIPCQRHHKATANEWKIPLDEKHWESKNYLPFGQCFSYNLPKILIKSGVSYCFFYNKFNARHFNPFLHFQVQEIALSLKMNSLVYIHRENSFFAPDTDDKVPVPKGIE